MRRLAGAHELLDGPLSADVLEANLRDLARVNRWLGGTALSWQALQHVTRSRPPRAELRLLDVGTGAADIPLALVRRSRARPPAVTVVATDIRPEIVAAARRWTHFEPRVSIELGRPAGIDYLPDSFDVVHASLVLHHLEPHEAADLLAEMARVSAGPVIVNDLFRRAHAWLGAWLLARVATRNRYTRHDAALSVRRAYAPAEVAALARPAGLRPVHLQQDRFRHRYALLLQPTRAAGKKPDGRG